MRVVLRALPAWRVRFLDVPDPASNQRHVHHCRSLKDRLRVKSGGQGRLGLVVRHKALEWRRKHFSCWDLPPDPEASCWHLGGGDTGHGEVVVYSGNV